MHTLGKQSNRLSDIQLYLHKSKVECFFVSDELGVKKMKKMRCIRTGVRHQAFVLVLATGACAEENIMMACRSIPASLFGHGPRPYTAS